MHDKTEHFSDETLMAYADGELDGELARRVEHALAANHALRQRLAIFERTGRCLAEAFEIPPAREPAPLARHRSVGGARSKGWLEGLRNGWERLVPSPAYGLAGFAAVVLLAAGLAAVIATLTPRPGATALVEASVDGRLIAAGRLQAALESSGSLGFASPGSREPYAVQTFRNREGAFCREYAAPQAASRGIACRSADGRWLIALQTAATAQPDESAGYVPAGSEQDQIIDGFVHGIMQGDPLALEQEKRAIDNMWRE